jgi:hypothetical protein
MIVGMKEKEVFDNYVVFRFKIIMDAGKESIYSEKQPSDQYHIEMPTNNKTNFSNRT